MNKENILLLAKTIRDHSKQFSILHFSLSIDDDNLNSRTTVNPIHGCGTVCCIAGFANSLFHKELKTMDRSLFANIETAAEYMGLPLDFCGGLFFAACYRDGDPMVFPWNRVLELGIIESIHELEYMTAEQAAQILEAIVDGSIEVV